jgi:hypothetical protein
MKMKDILIKLANGENSFDCTYNEQKRKCKILKLDLTGMEDGYGVAYVRFDKPVKKTIRKEVEEQWGFDVDYSPMMEDVEVESSEEWITI